MGLGSFGRILWIKLSDETFKKEFLDEEIYRQYLGGYRLAVKLIYENMSSGIDVLSPQSILGFFLGLLTGTTASFSWRYMVTGKSPLKETWGDSNSGGTFGPGIKKCGCDAILFKGRDGVESEKWISIKRGS